MEYFIGGLVGATLVFFGLYLPTRQRVADLEYEVSELGELMVEFSKLDDVITRRIATAFLASFVTFALQRRRAAKNAVLMRTAVSRIARQLRGEINDMAGEYQSDDVPEFLRKQAD